MEVLKGLGVSKVPLARVGFREQESDHASIIFLSAVAIR